MSAAIYEIKEDEYRGALVGLGLISFISAFVTVVSYSWESTRYFVTDYHNGDFDFMLFVPFATTFFLYLAAFVANPRARAAAVYVAMLMITIVSGLTGLYTFSGLRHADTFVVGMLTMQMLMWAIQMCTLHNARGSSANTLKVNQLRGMVMAKTVNVALGVMSCTFPMMVLSAVFEREVVFRDIIQDASLLFGAYASGVSFLWAIVVLMIYSAARCRDSSPQQFLRQIRNTKSLALAVTLLHVCAFLIAVITQRRGEMGSLWYPCLMAVLLMFYGRSLIVHVEKVAIAHGNASIVVVPSAERQQQQIFAPSVLEAGPAPAVYAQAAPIAPPVAPYDAKQPLLGHVNVNAQIQQKK